MNFGCAAEIAIHIVVAGIHTALDPVIRVVHLLACHNIHPPFMLYAVSFPSSLPHILAKMNLRIVALRYIPAPTFINKYM